MPKLTGTQARARFLRARVARLATADADGRPHLVPVTFAAAPNEPAADGLVFAVDHKPKRGTALRRLDNIAANPAVSLLVDVYEEDWSRLWWARADGTAAILSPDEPGARAAVAALAGRYPAPAQYGDRPPQGPVVVVRVDRWSGWTYSPVSEDLA